MEDWTESFFKGAWEEHQLAEDDVERTLAEASFLEQVLGLGVGSRVLDAPCGTGRHSVALAARGCEVTGLDHNPTVLEAARARADEQAVEVDFREGDLRNLPFTGEFDAAFNYWGSFGYFSDEENLDVVRGYARALRPGGRLCIEGFLLETLLPGFEERSWDDLACGTRLLQERSFDFEQGRIEATWTWIRDGKETVDRTSMRLYTYRQLAELLAAGGFTEVGGCQAPSGAPLTVSYCRAAVVAVR